MNLSAQDWALYGAGIALTILAVKAMMQGLILLLPQKGMKLGRAFISVGAGLLICGIGFTLSIIFVSNDLWRLGAILLSTVVGIIVFAISHNRIKINEETANIAVPIPPETTSFSLFNITIKFPKL